MKMAVTILLEQLKDYHARAFSVSEEFLMQGNNEVGVAFAKNVFGAYERFMLKPFYIDLDQIRGKVPLTTKSVE